MYVAAMKLLPWKRSQGLIFMFSSDHITKVSVKGTLSDIFHYKISPYYQRPWNLFTDIGLLILQQHIHFLQLDNMSHCIYKIYVVWQYH